MDKYELIRSKDRYYYYDMVHHISELYSGALPDGHTFTKSMIDGIIRNTINNGIDEMLITDGVIGETKIHSYPIIDKNGNCYEYENVEYLDVYYSITFLSTKQVIEYMKLRVELKTFDPPLDFKKYFLGMNFLKPTTADILDSSPTLPKAEEAPLAEPKVEIQQNVELVDKPKYCFVKNGNFWNIHFGDIELNGLKHYTGMDYIKLLLQQPHKNIDVFDLQALLNPNINTKIKRSISDDYMDNDDAPLHANNGTIRDEGDDTNPYANSNKWLSPEAIERVAVLKQELPELKADLEKATLHNDIAEQTRLTALVSMLEEELFDILKFRSDDPIITSNRKKVWKSIEDARKYIYSEEILRGYVETPVFNYLKEYIKTGYYCQYNPPGDDSKHWILH